MLTHDQVANFAENSTGSSEDTASRPTMKRQNSQAGFHDGDQWVSPTGPVTFHTHAANPTLTWETDIDWLKRECQPEMQVWVKGIATADDAILALHHGVDGIVVSNHGGRQLNGALATIDALPEIGKSCWPTFRPSDRRADTALKAAQFEDI